MRKTEIRAFRRLARRFTRVTGGLLGDTICCSGLSVPQAHALLEIEDSPGTSLGALSEALALDKSTVSRTVDGLVNLRLVERGRDAADGRRVRLTLTGPGAAACDAINGLGDRVVGRAFELIPEESHGAIVESMRLLVEASEIADRECGTDDGAGLAADTQKAPPDFEGDR